jgi:hypothetical protein
LPGGIARQQQVSQVQASDEQDQTDRTHQQQQHGTQVAGAGLRQRLNGYAYIAINGMLRGKRSGNRG